MVNQVLPAIYHDLRVTLNRGFSRKLGCSIRLIDLWYRDVNLSKCMAAASECGSQHYLPNVQSGAPRSLRPTPYPRLRLLGSPLDLSSPSYLLSVKRHPKPTQQCPRVHLRMFSLLVRLESKVETV